jgi:heptosyltransferase-3
MIPAKKSIQSILWISFCNGIGDAVLMYPAIKKCAALFPSARIDIALRSPAARETLRACGFTGKILTAPGGFAHLAPWLIKTGICSYSVTIDASSIEQLHISRFASRLTSALACIGYHYGSSSWLYTIKLDTTPLAQAHIKDIYGHLLSPFAPVPALALESPPSLPGLLDGLNIPESRPRIVIHPGGRDNIASFEKRWPIDRFKILIERLCTSSGAGILLVGSGEEKNWLERNLDFAGRPGVVNLAGKISVAQLFEIIHSANIFIGNNSGPLHIAAACRTPLLTFAGGVPMSRWGVTEGNQAIVVGMDKRCPSCTGYECERHGRPCLEAISVDEVFTAVESLMRLQPKPEL